MTRLMSDLEILVAFGYTPEEAKKFEKTVKIYRFDSLRNEIKRDSPQLLGEPKVATDNQPDFTSLIEKHPLPWNLTEEEFLEDANSTPVCFCHKSREIHPFIWSILPDSFKRKPKVAPSPKKILELNQCVKRIATQNSLRQPLSLVGAIGLVTGEINGNGFFRVHFARQNMLPGCSEFINAFEYLLPEEVEVISYDEYLNIFGSTLKKT